MRITRGLVTALLAGAAGAALASAGAHYEGHARSGLEVHVYLHGGVPLGRDGRWQAVRVTTHASRGRRELPAFDDCVYRYDEADRRAGRIDCASRPGSPLDGVAYARDPKADADDPEVPMVCVTRCGRGVPGRLVLDAHPDNH